MKMFAIDDPHLARLRACCRDEAAFQQLQAILAQWLSSGSDGDRETSASDAADLQALQGELARARYDLDRQRTVSRIIARIRAPLDARQIFEATAKEVRELLGADRVGVFAFYPGSGWDDGEFVSESVREGYASALSAKVRDRCFGNQFAADYTRGRCQVVSDIYDADLSDCHIHILSQFQVRANLIVPLLRDNEELWGLLCIHQCSGPRDWTPQEIAFVKEIATHLGIAIHHLHLLEETQTQTRELSLTLRDLRSAQMQLVQAEKMSSLGQLVAGVAHEINNPVNFIYGNLSHVSQYAEDLIEMLQLYRELAPLDDERIQTLSEEIDLEFLVEDLPKMMASMKMGADRIRQIVLSLRNFSRLDEAEMKPVNLHEGLESTLLIVQHRLKGRADLPNIEIVKDYGDLPSVECFAGPINQVFMNVIVNAIDALDEYFRGAQQNGTVLDRQPTLTLRTQLDASGERAIVTIADNGPGIPTALRPQLFDTFFTTKPAGKGTGLGLAISYQIIVDKHGGNLTCESTVGQGTAFHLEIPVKRVATPTHAKSVAVRQG